MFQMLNRSLGAKVLVLVSLLTIVAFTGLFLANSYWQRKTTLEQINAQATRTSEMLQLAVAEPMAIGDNTATTSAFSRVAQSYKDLNVFMTDYKGNVTYSTDQAVLRKDFDQLFPNPRLKSMLESGLKEHSESHDMVEIGGTPYMAEFRSIPNGPDCYHCHGASKPVLGVMAVLQDVTGQMATLRNQQFQGALISLTGLVVLLASLLLFMKRTVINRIKNISVQTENVARGDMNVCFNVGGQDEVSKLCEYIANMVSRMKDQLEYNKGILHGIIIPMFVADTEERFEYVNRPLQGIIGKPEDQIMGRRVDEIFHTDGHIAAEVVRTGESRNGLMRFTRDDGVTFPMHYEVSPLKDANERTVGAIGVLIDLTQEERDKAAVEAHRQSLLDVATEVTEVARKLSTAAEGLSSQMVDLTKGVDRTAERTTEVATAMEEMNATVLEVAKNAGQTAEASEKASHVASDGGVGVQNTVRETKLVAETTRTLATTLNELSSRAENIGRVMSVINDIADQTNLLALNAAIEAARAGDAGRGFAVVADEVRKLAEKTMTATKEVDSAIHEIQSSAFNAVREMEGTQERVVRTTGLADGAGKVLEEIVGQSNSIADMVRSIASAAEQQSSTSDEINISLSEISGLSQDISQRIQQANASIHEVSRMAQHLGRLVERFRE